MSELLKFFKDIFGLSSSSEPIGLTCFNKQETENKTKFVVKKRQNKKEINITELMRHRSEKSALK